LSIEGVAIASCGWPARQSVSAYGSVSAAAASSYRLAAQAAAGVAARGGLVAYLWPLARRACGLVAAAYSTLWRRGRWLSA